MCVNNFAVNFVYQNSFHLTENYDMNNVTDDSIRFIIVRLYFFVLDEGSRTSRHYVDDRGYWG